ncbi:MAG: hypothetical protein V1846_00880 [Candidatus Komeilibacteria bacterium]
MAWQDAFKGFDMKKIGAGRLFRSGRNYRERQGLEGAFRELKDPKYGNVADNLSSDNVAKFKSMLEEKLKHKYEHTEGLNFYDRRDLIHQLEQLRRHGEISSEDEKDFKVIIDKLTAH